MPSCIAVSALVVWLNGFMGFGAKRGFDWPSGVNWIPITLLFVNLLVYESTCCTNDKLGSMAWFKGELNRFFFIGPGLRQVLKGNFHRKAPKWVKNQVKGSKIDQIRTKWHPTCWGNPPILSSELLRESINSVIRPTEGIHYNYYIIIIIIIIIIPSVGWMTELLDSLSSSEDRIGGFPQQVGWQNWWITSAALRTELMDSLSRSEDRIDGFPQ